MNKAVQAILRYKVLHIFFWSIKALLLYHQIEENRPTNGALNYVDAISTTFYQMVCVYTALYVLIPRLFINEKYLRFSLAVLTLIGICTLASVLTELLYLRFIFRPDYKFNLITVLINYIGQFVEMSVIALIFIVISLVYYFYMRDQKNKLLERERLESELNFLKAQINPHFLFNAINSIYVLMKEDIRLSEEVLLKFSDLLRYQLYDCGSNETTIEKEIEFLRNYVALENVRHGESTKVDFRVPGEIIYLKVAPFILIPFVENAFKHISHYRDKENLIDIDIAFGRGCLDFTISNTFEESMNRTHLNHKGIGLQNVKRRLELLYSQKHTLQISREDDRFMVRLTLITDEH